MNEDRGRTASEATWFVGGLLLALGGCVLHAHRGWGWLLVGAGGLLVLAPPAEAWRRFLDADVLRRPPVPLEVALLGIAFALAAWSTFSYLNSLAGIHFDTAETWSCVRERMKNLDHTSDAATLLRMSLETPHWTATAALVRWTGFSLAALRLIGAGLCFLSTPFVYLTARWMFNRGTAALATLAFSGSLWNFALSKVAAWDADVPFMVLASVASTYGVFHLRRGWLLLPVLLVSLVLGLNLYEAYRLAFPVCAAVALFGAFLVKGRRARGLWVGLVLGLSVWIQASAVDGLFWERISGSALVEARTLGTLRLYAVRLAGGLFYAGGDISDIYLSPSQNGVDHPVLMALFLFGLLLLVRNVLRPAGRPAGARTQDRFVSGGRFSAWSLLAWLLVPIAAAWFFEGQWRRASAAMPAIYLTAALPVAVAAGALEERLRRRRPSPTRRRIAFGVPAGFLLLVVLVNLARFPGIHQGRWGGYYKEAPEVAAASCAAKLCGAGDLSVVLLTGAWDSQAPLFWNFVGSVSGLTRDCFVEGESVFWVDEERSGAAERLLAEHRQDPKRCTAAFVRDLEPLAGVLARLEDACERVPPAARREAVPGAAGAYRLYYIGAEPACQRPKDHGCPE